VYLMMVFALIIVATGRLPVTRELIIAGTPARIFGVLLFLLCGPVLALIDYLLTAVLPQAIRFSLGFEILRWVLFGAIVFAAAWVLYAKVHAAVRTNRGET
jgi:hypothetical protein